MSTTTHFKDKVTSTKAKVTVAQGIAVIQIKCPNGVSDPVTLDREEVKRLIEQLGAVNKC